ncbi:hypothetical protein [Patulibacter sp. SYSU D01012]|uniref:hypothetical protein n=1 Tax=Patulibacter sp. SYSU D01012 TaxID=2817381 RepID=UPI001B30EFC1|nr:hypothetical protein [Patulibacter sp. SYSU D01012]
MIGVLAVPQVAGARPWAAEYDWQASSRTGYENWVAEESVPGSGQPLPFYRTYLGGAPAQIGRGLAIAPLGGRVYDNGDPASQTGGPGLILRWAVPGASRITAARFDDVRYRNANDGQYLRLRLAGPGGHQDVDLGPDFDEEDANTTYSRGPYTQTVPGGGTSAELWMFTVCGSAPQGEPGPFRCPTIAAGTPTFGRLGSARLTLDDPDQPALAVDASPAIDDGWVNKRRTQRLQITAADPSSGIQRIRVQVRAGTAGTGGRTLKTQTVACDPDHTTPGRAGLVCPVTAGTDAVDPAGSQTGSDRTYVVAATDYAGNERSQSFTVRRDVQKPGAATLGGELADVARDWTNLRKPVNARVRVRDERSGVAKVEVLAERQTGGRKILLGKAEPDCTGGCRSLTTNVAADLGQLERDGTYRLYVRSTDRAGNARLSRVADQGGWLKIDRTDPKTDGRPGRLTIRRDGTVRLVYGVARDRDSGLREYVIRYYPAPDGGSRAATPRFATARLSEAQPASPRERRFFGSRTRVLTFKPRGGIDRDRQVVLVQLDRARGDLRDPDKTGGRYGNFSETELRPIIFGGRGVTAEEVYDDLRLERLGGALEQNEQMLGIGKKPAAVEKLARIAAKAARVIDRANFIASVLDPLIDPDVTACASRQQDNLVISASRTWEHIDVASYYTGLTLDPERGDPNDDVAKTQRAIANARVALRQLRAYAEQYKMDTHGGKGCGVYATAVLEAVGPAMDAVIHMFIAHNAAVRPERDPRDRLYGCDFADATRKSALPPSSDKRRWNLCWWTKLKPGNGGVPERAQAHHLFPQQFRENFRAAGIAIDEPWYMCWFGADHQGMSEAYNREWRAWLRRRGRLTSEDRVTAINYMFKLQKHIRPSFSCDVTLNEKHSATLGDPSQRVESSPGI